MALSNYCYSCRQNYANHNDQLCPDLFRAWWSAWPQEIPCDCNPNAPTDDTDNPVGLNDPCGHPHCPYKFCPIGSCLACCPQVTRQDSDDFCHCPCHG